MKKITWAMGLFFFVLLGYSFYLKTETYLNTENRTAGKKQSAPFFNPADLNFTDDFEAAASGWTFTEGTSVNKWAIGTAAFNGDGSTKGLYISNDEGATNSYTIGGNNATIHAVKQLPAALPADIEDVQVSFDWRCAGEGATWDYFKVWIVPATFTPTEGTLMAAADGVQVGGVHNLNPDWVTVNYVVNLSAYAGENVKVIFEWRNDGSGGTQPPAAIDNLKIKGITCSAPSALSVSNIVSDAAQINWTAPAGVTNFDYYYSTTNTTPADTQTPSGTSTTTTASLSDLTPNTPYYVWVRSNCGTVNGKSFWIPVSFTTACVAIDVPFMEGFNSGSTTESCWTVINANNDGDAWDMNYTSNPYEGNQVAVMYTDGNGENNDDWLISPTLNLSASPGGKRLRYFYRVQSEFEPNDFRVMLSTTGTGVANFTETIVPLASYDNTTYIEKVVDLVDGSGTPYSGNVNIAFHVPPGGLDGWRLYIDKVVVEDMPACPDPTDLTLVSMTENTATLQWTAGASETSWHLLALPAGSPLPNATATGYTVSTTNPGTIPDLTPATAYDFYIRAVCNATENGGWIGPVLGTTTQIPAPVTFTDDFENSSGWTFTNGTQANSWIIGTAVAQAGTHSLYITNDNGTSNAYNTNSTTVTHAIRDLAFPANSNEALISFNWKAQGESTWDYLRVWLVPSTYQPVEGVQISAENSGGIQIENNFNQQQDWQLYSQIYNVSAYAGQTRRLVFEWRNDGSGGTQPPAAVDNVQVKLLTCPRPVDIVIERNNVGNMIITWTPVGTETQWEVIVQPATDPAPTDASTGVIVNDTPQYIYEDAAEGVVYNVYVRAICSAEDKSVWAGPETFSVFNPPACANIDISLPDLDIDNNGDYYYCQDDGEVTINLDANFDASKFKSTTSYAVEAIDFEPPFPFLGGTIMPITSDDDYTASFSLPFDFCFFGNSYNFCRIGDNGVVTFGLPFTTTYGDYCDWQLDGLTIPDTDFTIKNSIYGVYQDLWTTNNPGPNSQINYQVLGTYPCRALVVNFNEVPSFGCDEEEYRMTTQIVLYEITNIIEVYVKDRKACMSWGSDMDGEGVLGIQNADGTLAYTPPGRNTGPWEAHNEAWRFTPNGPTDVSFAWYMNGELLTTNPQHTVTISENTEFEAVVSYPGCGEEDLVLRKGFKVKVSEAVEPVKPSDIRICTIQEVNLRLKDEEVLANTENPDKFTVSYYTTEQDAEDDTNAINNPENFAPTTIPQTIYVRQQSTETECFGTTSFQIILEAPLPLTKPDDIVLCVYDNVIPAIDLNQVKEKLLSQIDANTATVTYYETMAEAQSGTGAITTPENYQAPVLPQEIFARVSDPSPSCDAIVSFMLIEGDKNPEYALDDFEICTNYVLPELPPGYYYSTERLGGGTLLKAGEILGMGEHTIFVNSDSKDGCVSTGSYKVTVVSCTIPKGISPNGDGLNDALDLARYRPAKVSIFNRYGKEVYMHGPGYTNQWVGQDKSGKLLPEGTYYYHVLTATEELTGYVQLVREVK